MEPDLVAEYQCEGEGRCRDMFWEFIYIVVIPLGVLFLVVLIVSIILCCGSCKRKKKGPASDDPQLFRYNSIKRATLNLRHLSHNRDTPLLSSQAERDAKTASLNLDGEHFYRRPGRGTASAPGTLQRDRQNRYDYERPSSSTPRNLREPAGTARRNPHERSIIQTQGEVNQGSGVEYAEVHHGLTAAIAKGEVQTQ